jgi:tRNA(Ile)-lysidine synthase
VHPLVRHLARELARFGVARDQPVLVACSGGPDSTALADATMALSRSGGVGPVTLVHVDHGLRAGSGSEGEVVRRLGEAGAAGVMLLRARVGGGASLERAAREARYAALDRCVATGAAAWVLLGHTASDQAETVLMRLVSGTGITGLAGIPERRGPYLRPFLRVSRTRLLAYLAERGLPALDDPMNRDPRFARSRARHSWLPLLGRDNPQLEAALCRAAASAREQREVLDALARRVAAEARERSGVPGGYDVAVLAAAPPAAAKRALVLAWLAATGRPLSARHQEALWALIAGPGRGTVSLDLPGMTAVRQYGTLLLGAAARPPPAELSVRGPRPPYAVRAWRPGDRMRPVRLRGRSRKLSDLYVDAKIPAGWRRDARVVVCESSGEIVWAEHLGPAVGSEVEVVLTRSHLVATNRI